MTKAQSRTCEQCGKTYIGRGLRFCGNACKMTFVNLHNNPAKSEQARAKIAASRIGKPTTTGRVLPESQRANISKAIRGRTLTPEHRAAIGAGVKAAGNIPPRNPHLVGPAHPNWSGGHTTVRSADHESPEYKAFRKAVLDRDDWTCQDCGKRGGKLEVHHVKSWGPYPDLRYDVGNGVALCRPCHLTRHRNVPRPITVGPRTLADLRLGQSEDA